MSSPQTTVLITGASRGIGRGLAKAYLARPNHTVVAAVRDTSAKSVASLQAMQPAHGSKLQVVKIDGKVDSDPAEATQATTGGWRLFAGLHHCQCRHPRPLRGAGDRNALAPGRFRPQIPGHQHNSFQHPEPRGEHGFHAGGYGASKAALNYIVRRISFDLVQTDMGNAGARFFGMEKAIQTTEESVNGIIKKLDAATTETTSGNFYDWDGSDMNFRVGSREAYDMRGL
ncbi:NAD(P)-binding protein [Apiospora aurea]|uniref:NAD(P)-binding protein n=1 Tax=Apiospora aurea TaxID=335848 RepID=A0ABR1Q5D8_9PEZI